MTTSEKPFSIPTRLIVLEIVGTLFVVIGLLELTGGVEILPVALRFDDYGFAFIAAGIVLMLPLTANVVAQVIKRAKQ